ncbi:MAG TPA: aminopeptidase P family N-terminal domain-containing protein [Bauldia sp.]|nr:aminopeptidase P family N-terminal domain-containing protein [Bauldia sp.]
MARAVLTEATLPDFGMPTEQPEVPKSIYATRLAGFVDRFRAANFDAVVVYADREHSANISYLTGFDPRFEEALMVVLPRRTPVLLAGPENRGFAATAKIDLEVVLYPPFGLMGQDRSKTRPLADVLREAGLSGGAKVGVVGWKYYSAAEAAAPDDWSEAPSFIVDTLRAIVGASGRVANANGLLMHSSTGMRAVNEIEQIAAFEFAACHTSEAVKAVVRGVSPGMTEHTAARLLAPIGLPLSCHTMLSAGPRAFFGLGSPGHRVMERGDPFTTAFGVWGALNCRAGWLVEDAGELPAPIRDYVERLVAPYFLAVADWYEAIGIGVTGGELDAIVKRRIGDPFFGLFLPPGHLIHIDEWMNTPIYPGSAERLQSGQAIQVDVIPATGSAYFTSNMEDGIALLDVRGRAQFAERYPHAWQRIVARRAFMADVIGIRLKDEVLPLCNIAAALPPFILAPQRIMTVRQ